MAKAKTVFVCQQCGANSPAYLGRCPSCGAWQSMVETIAERTAPSASRRSIVNARPLTSLGASESERITVPIGEFNRVLGGGLVAGSLVLVGGDPGIGKSTLVLQAAAALAGRIGRVLYVSGEESAQQIRIRADRLGIASDDLWVLSETDLAQILGGAETDPPGLLIIDSIQTVYVDEITSAAGSVSQVRECTARLAQWAKPKNIPVMIVGHVTKEGTIAGPRVLEHMVDAVLYLEGDRYHQYRILRSVKNRFGSTDEVGVFEMVDAGLREVRNPSEAFLAERSGQAAGSTVAVTMEGTRPILVEVQALTATTSYGIPRRSANGLDNSRLQLLVAVLQKRVGLALGSQDIYANVVGGLRIVEPAADLAVALAIASSFKDLRADAATVAIGEIGLSGELRSVSQLDRRLNEAARLGFQRGIVPAAHRKGAVTQSADLEIVSVASVEAAIRGVLEPESH